MDRIFSEIKKAIEEEMRNAESGSAPPQRQQGGRRAQEYAEWLKEEQGRLRGTQQSEPIEEVPVEAPDDWQRQQRERAEVSTRRHEEQRRQRSSDGAQRGGTQYRRSEARHQRRTADAYATRQSTGAETRRRIQQLMGTRQGLRQAFLLREIVSKPVSLREPDDHLIT